ncbi:uncharacterized protein LOC134248210 [Saccostrea cucullata]|uniref:uncharacterized protein LOC134248210 n=1 Tax=Saccostrea cuccullata TaxID=36930 RepID=UPI002ED50E82
MEEVVRDRPDKDPGEVGGPSMEKVQIEDTYPASHCHLCHEIGESVPASLVCKEEQIYLCNPCGKRHQFQRSTKSHTVTDIEEYKKLFCEICECLNEKVPAYAFCETCEDPEYFCLPCSKRHIASEIFKSHSICTNLDKLYTKFAQVTQNNIDRDAKTFNCTLCTDIGEYRTASCFCTSCKIPEPLCDVCGRHHIRQKIFRDHSLSPDMEAFASILKSNNINCEMCLLDGEHKRATSFCLTCKEIEALCEDCAAQHLRQKLFRNHMISKDIANLPKNDELFCKPCTTEGGKTQADSFCKDCDEPEPLCRECARQHIKQRQFRHHSICDDISQISICTIGNSSVLCAVCKEEGIDTKANCFCHDCDDQEPLCSECGRQHMRQKIFRGHKLCKDLSLLLNIGKEQVFCDVCKIDGKDVLADAYCTDCSDLQPLCNDCAGHHIKQKQFRNHKIDTDISGFIKLQNRDDVSCDICKIDENHAKAMKYCHDCDEHLCKNCVEIHLKFSREHEITDNFGNSFLCEPCKRENKSLSADFFCENCEEPMCKTCSEQHLKQKPFRGHVISSNMLKYSKPKLEGENVDGPSQVLEKREVPEKSKEHVETKKRIRGKPCVLYVKSDSVELYWETLEEEIDYYQIRYKSLNINDKWKFCSTNDTTNRFTVSGLMANTPYVFQVRSVANDVEGVYSEQSDPINTLRSLATKMLRFSIKIKSTDPVMYQLVAEENREACNLRAKTRHLTLGNPSIGIEYERTIMLVGEKGSGKSTLVDSFMNYILGVSFEDPFRFTLVKVDHEEKKTENHAECPAEWITIYKIDPQEGSRLDYTLNIIDIPGFGDTRKIQKNKAIVDQISHLFSTEGKQGVSFIDAVCFIVKAPDTRLTATQTNIFYSIMSLLGKDIESNICTLITFSDGAEPPVLSCLKAADLPFRFWFPFNNSALFASNKNLQNASLSPNFWELCYKSLQDFFQNLKLFTPKSLVLTKEVLKQREHLQAILANVEPKVKAGLSKINELQNTLTLFKKHLNEIESNRDFTYEAEYTKQIKLDLPPGQHVTNCLICNMSCHDNCEFADDDQKIRCSAMDSKGNCKVCSGKCHWKQHKNGKYIFKYVTEKKIETYREKKERYERAIGEKMTNEKYLKEIEDDIDSLFDSTREMMNEMELCKNRLKEIALRPGLFSAVEEIDQMIQAEETKKQVGYEKRIKMLNEFKTFLQIDKSVESFQKTVQKVKDDFSKTTGRKRERKTCAQSGFERFKYIFS